MNDQTLSKIQFDHVTEALAGLCACGLGKKLARGESAAELSPKTSRAK